MDPNFFIILNSRWLSEPSIKKRLSQGLCPVGAKAGHLVDGCAVQVKFRNEKRQIYVDPDAQIKFINDQFFIKSIELSREVQRACAASPWLALFFEGAPGEARCIFEPWSDGFLASITEDDPTIRLAPYDVPPSTATVVDSEALLRPLYKTASSQDPELFAVYASRFLEAPHIITALFSHVFTIQADDNIRFPVVVKKLAEQLRGLLSEDRSGVTIKKVNHSHVDLWADVQGERFGFLDGGVARIPAMAGLEPIGLRVGIYSVRPGIVEPETREQWRMAPYVIGDLIDRARPTLERPDMRRLHEAARYVLEPLTGLQHLGEFPDTRLLLLHGPLVNQFLTYDEGVPNFVPFISPAFLSHFGINQSSVTSALAYIPPDSTGAPMWNQFMAIYAYVLYLIDENKTPLAGVVERPTGRPVIHAVLEKLKDDEVIREAYVKQFTATLERYDITDDFLFGCVLRAGEYITPVLIQKNLRNRSRERWQPIVDQYRQPRATLLKTEEMNFPFRVEMNAAAAADSDFLARFLYHTARLLPRYAFPVGLDIVDKYAKIPDWISRGVSAQLSAAVLRRALKTGDVNLVSQIRLLLTKDPRDFFFRPSSQL